MIDVRACTNAPQVELFVNGRRQGRQKIDHASGKSLLGNWRVPYEPGTITAIAYDENGKEVARDERRSFESLALHSLLLLSLRQDGQVRRSVGAAQ